MPRKSILKKTGKSKRGSEKRRVKEMEPVEIYENFLDEFKEYENKKENKGYSYTLNLACFLMKKNYDEKVEILSILVNLRDKNKYSLGTIEDLENSSILPVLNELFPISDDTKFGKDFECIKNGLFDENAQKLFQDVKKKSKGYRNSNLDFEKELKKLQNLARKNSRKGSRKGKQVSFPEVPVTKVKIIKPEGKGRKVERRF